ncbi:MAG TPA: M20/M25/M40 family metallo-hydrolase [Vicinamibacterales bacterium]|nr:M20/M25/M40 family metallo-hydrolase [Vicinamibacterales bacterium]
MAVRRPRIRAGAPLCLAVSLAAALHAQPAPWVPKVRAWIDANQQPVVRELVELLSIPNVAADRANIRRNAGHLAAMLQKRGFTSELLETEGNPLVYGELRVPGATRTLLIYSHYDGQPVDPKNWKQADPFTPVVKAGKDGAEVPDALGRTRFDPEWRIYARSASDDKSPIVMLVAALDALKAAGTAPSSNIRVILDGEEEAGSPNLVPAIARYRDRLAADLMVILDGPQHSSGRPTIAYGARGIARVDITVFGPRAGVHSGNYGNWIPNPAQRLALLLASMKDETGRVLVKGWYDGIDPLTPEEQKMAAAVPDDAEAMLRAFGVARPETAFPRLQEALQYPTLNVRGLASAFVGAGARTIIPDSATAAIDIRLVKETPAESMLAKIRAHVVGQGYHVVEGAPDDDARAKHAKIARLQTFGDGTNAFRTSPLDPQARALAASLRGALGVEPVHLRTLGGTVPIAPFIEALGFPAVLVPTVNFDNNQHEENENLRIANLFDGILTVAAILRM